MLRGGLCHTWLLCWAPPSRLLLAAAALFIQIKVLDSPPMVQPHQDRLQPVASAAPSAQDEDVRCQPWQRRCDSVAAARVACMCEGSRKLPPGVQRGRWDVECWTGVAVGGQRCRWPSRD